MNGRAVLAAAGVLVLGAMAGCVSYANYPAVPKNLAVNNPNNPAMEDVAMASIGWVVSKYPPGPEGTPFAVNAPMGVKPSVYRRIASAAGPGAEPLTTQNTGLPVYHIGGIRVRGDQANVWIYRPVISLGRMPQGSPVYQEVKLWLQGGLSPWHVVNAIDRTPGATEVPDPNFYEPEPEPVVKPSHDDDPVYKPGPKKTAPAPKPPEEPAPAGETTEPPKPESYAPKPQG